jgi:hypothetical protein
MRGAKLTGKAKCNRSVGEKSENVFMSIGGGMAPASIAAELKIGRYRVRKTLKRENLRAIAPVAIQTDHD